MPGAQPPTDAGLAGERTALAWNRSGLAAVVCIAALLRHIWPLHGAGQEVALAVIAGAAVMWALVLATLTRANRRRPVRRGAGVLCLMTVATVTLAVVGFVLGLLVPG